MARSLPRRAGSAALRFLSGLLLAVVALLSPALIFIGLILFTVGKGTWPIGLSLAGALGLGFFVPAMASMREESRWSRMGGAGTRDKCAHCRAPIGSEAFIRAPAPLKGVIHTGCYPKAFVRRNQLA